MPIHRHDFDHDRAQNGYTLIEILIVLFIVSIVASVALITISHNKNNRIKTFANDLTQLLSLAEEQALLQPTIIGINFAPDAYDFYSYDPNQKKNNWIALQDKLLTKHDIPQDVEVQVQIVQQKPIDDGQEEKEEEREGIPQIIISANGDLTPFNIRIGKKGEKPLYQIQGHADGTISNQTL